MKAKIKVKQVPVGLARPWHVRFELHEDIHTGEQFYSAWGKLAWHRNRWVAMPIPDTNDITIIRAALDSVAKRCKTTWQEAE